MISIELALYVGVNASPFNVLIIANVSKALNKEFSSIDEILEVRKQARAEKNWDIADKIRIALDEAGIIVKDTKEGTTLEAK